MKLRESLEMQIGETQKIKFDPMGERLNRSQFDELKNTIRRQNNKNKK